MDDTTEGDSKMKIKIDADICVEPNQPKTKDTIPNERIEKENERERKDGNQNCTTNGQNQGSTADVSNTRILGMASPVRGCTYLQSLKTIFHW